VAAARAPLEKKLGETNGRIVAAAVEVVALEEKRLWARVERDEAFRLAAMPVPASRGGEGTRAK